MTDMTDSAPNQYAPPMATVEDVAPASGYGELRLFSPKGRIGRLRYLAYASGASLVHLLAGMLLSVVGQVYPTAGGVLSLVLLGLLAAFAILAGIKRCHDIGVSGWWTLTIFIPVIAFVWLFWPGDREANRFGPPPPPNNWGVRVLGAVLPLLGLLGLLAAIAIPAYQGYAKARGAAQEASQRP